MSRAITAVAAQAPRPTSATSVTRAFPIPGSSIAECVTQR